ncbi:adenosylmethionine--8-amino-7-oxononanoate transaminase [Xylophilus sp.]|uniref:adenosylmethionine--8-amino-7-oxononanoate transaminase n=1 Tax=Xylophilus sp. TaxID=2653893 RepID=UPI0013B87D87|nr:adenosylmethionine--8-amino-7-oxononanoate transaminase [Xylophilus sp.]KAF1044690.1 MAG: Adenosylmethionine-8-amino-7-oxononanoate aminotransferase [Xylophilus sp.]
MSLDSDLAQRSLRAVWHPCTQMARAAQLPPLPIARGEGPWLFDTAGRRYFDANSSWWVNLFGHSDEGLRAAIARQLHTLPHVMLAGCTHEPAVRLAERLAARTGGALGHASFASDGASAVEIALKMSFHYWKNREAGGTGPQRDAFVCLKNSYHGETIGALAVTDVQIFRDAYAPLLTQSHTVASPDARLGNEDAAIDALRDLLERERGRIAAVIVEPLVQGAAGMVMHAPSYLKRLRALATAHGVHLIADEIAVGFGRTGSFYAWEQADAPWPDFLLLSKGITGGTLPLSVVLTTDAVFDAFWSDDVARGFLHSHSYTGNALACAAANAVLDRFDAGQVEANRQQAQFLADAFAPLAAHPRVEHLRQRGMILAFDVRSAGDRFSERFHLAARRHELLIRPIGDTVYLMPPYLIDEAAAVFLAGAVGRTLGEVVDEVIADAA